MNGNRFIIIFAIIAIILLNVGDFNSDELINSVNKKISIEETFMNAVDAGAKALIDETDDGKMLEKEKAAKQFFYTLFAGLGILDSPYQQELLRLYVPVMAVTAEDGFYIFYSEEYESDGRISITKRWSELIPYEYEDENFIYRFTLGDKVSLYDKNKILSAGTEVITTDYHEFQTNAEYEVISTIDPENIMLSDEEFHLAKRTAIMGKMEEYLSYYVNRNNYIAEHLGITYEFMLPETDESEWVRSLETPGIIVVFQGYPYNNGRDYYNQFTVAAAGISRNEVYYIVPEDWYYICHRANCTYFVRGSEIKTCYDMKSGALEGAYACEYCIPEGVHKKEAP